MAKRFSMREIALLTAPVLAIGALAFWASKRPQVVGDARLSFQIDQPTTLEKFSGVQAAIVMSFNERGQNTMWSAVPYLELQTPRGVVVSRGNDNTRTIWGNVWKGTANNTRFTVNLNQVPQGELSFGCDAVVQPYPLPGGALTAGKSFQVAAKQKIDRTQLQPLNLSTWPRQPLVSIRSMEVDQASAGEIIINVLFQLEGMPTNEEASFEMNAFCAEQNVSYTAQDYRRRKPKSPQQHTAQVFVYLNKKTRNLPVKITGRVSADSRWPLGFQIEPFDFTTAKVGQKLKFKQFPVALPKP